MFRPATVALLTALALMGVAPPASPEAPPVAQATLLPANARIVFSHEGDIWIAHPSGSQRTRLTRTAAFESSPSISRTGRYVAFRRGLDGVLLDRATNRQRSLGRGLGFDFSPTSDRLAFSVYENGRHRLVSMNVDGSGRRYWYTYPGTGIINLNPRWSGDGRALYYYGSKGARMCRVDRGGYDDLYYAYRLFRVTETGATSQAAGSDAYQIFGGQMTGGVLAYVRDLLPAANAAGYCRSEPGAPYEVVIAGRVVRATNWPMPPSVSVRGDVAFTAGNGAVFIDPAGSAGPQWAFAGTEPDWGVAYAP